MKGFEIELNHMLIEKMEESVSIALEQTAEALHTEIVQAQVVPRDQGTLQNEAFFVDNHDVRQGNVTLVHSTPYARRLYYHPEYKFQTHENPNAKGKWLEDWLLGGKEQDFAQETFAGIYKRLTGV